MSRGTHRSLRSIRSVVPCTFALGLAAIIGLGNLSAEPPSTCDEAWTTLAPVVRQEAVQSLRLPEDLPAEFDVQVLLDGSSRTVRFRRHSLRAPGFRLRVYGDDGRTVDVPPPTPATYRGSVVGRPELSVTGDLRDEGLNARIAQVGGRAWVIRSLPDQDRDSPRTLHEVGFEDLGEEDPLAASRHGGSRVGLNRASRSHGGQHRAEIAFDADNPFYLANGATVPSTVAAVEALLNEVDLAYARDTLITYTITQIIVRATPFYTSGGTLGEFQAEWNTNQTGVQRDMAHLVSDFGGGAGGTAFLGVTCDIISAYGTSGGGASVMAHELGHNWNADHCHDSWPCNAMCGGGCSTLTPATSDVIVAFRDTLTCLDDIGAHPDPLPPYANPEAADLTRDEIALGANRTFDVLANDYDGNLDPLSIDAFDASSLKSGGVTLSVGTGTGGSNELVYSTPPVVFGGSDRFTYTLGDGQSGQTTGNVRLRVEAPGLLGYWGFNEGTGLVTADETGDGRQGDITGASWTAGSPGFALSFDGADDEVIIPPINLEMSSSTIVVKLRRDGLQDPFAGIVTDRSSNSGISFSFGNADELRYLWNDNPATSGWDSGLVVPNLQWVLAALVVEPQQATIYMHDGVTLQSAVNSVTHQPQIYDGQLFIGSDPLSPTQRYKGSMDELRIYNYALSAAEISTLAGSRSKAHAPSPKDGGRLPPGFGALSWKPGMRATSRDVYFGTDYVAVRDATTVSPEFQGNFVATSFDLPPPLLAEVNYYWRVDENRGGSVVKGDVWIFSVGPPVGWWKLDETSGGMALDSAGTRDGTYLGGAALDQSPAHAELGRSVFFDGIDDAVQIPPLDLDSEEVTITIWLRRSGTQTDSAGVVFTRSASSVAGLIFGGSNELRHDWNSAGVLLSGTTSWDFGAVVPDDTWVFAALVVEEDATRMYLGQGGTLTEGAPSFTRKGRELFDGDLYIGRDPIGGRSFAGYLDNVRVYDYALSFADLSSMLAAGIAAGSVPDGDQLAGLPLLATAQPNGDVELNWSASCVAADTDYAVYEGQIGDFDGQLPAVCSTAGATSTTIKPKPGSRYFLVAPRSGDREGGLGVDGAGQPRAQGPSICLPRYAATCP